MTNLSSLRKNRPSTFAVARLEAAAVAAPDAEPPGAAIVRVHDEPSA